MRDSKKDKEVFIQCKKLVKQGADPEEIIAFLKSNGYSQGVSSAFLSSIGLFDDFEAKKAVLESFSWRENYEENKKLQELISDEYVEFVENESNKDRK